MTPIKRKKPEPAKESNESTRGQNGKAYPVVGIGGSAGSFPSFEKFFAAMPPDSGMSFVIVMHLDPNYRSQLAEVVQRYTPMPVIEANDGVIIQPNKVYLIPPNKDMGIHNRKLLLLQPSKPNGIRQPIDYFFQSLAEDQWNRSVGIIFSGMGSDGETGIRMIKEKLGVAIVQDPNTAEYDSMPLAAIGTNMVDFVLSPEEMPLKLIQYMSHPALTDDDPESLKINEQNTNALQKILMLLRSKTGHDFTSYKRSTITRRIDRRVAFHQLAGYERYVDYLHDNPHEITTLFNELLIGVTKFFRDAQAFDALTVSIEKLIEHKKDQEPVRVWLAGCSTGEEAYSVAMVLFECLEAKKQHPYPKLQIYATDLDGKALEHARNGVYNGNIIADVSPERIERFFVKTGEQYAVKKKLREMIVFAQHNVISDAPFIRLDLLCCRNMLIYFTTELQKKIIPLFFYALNPGGLLFLGPAETVGGFTDLFSAADPKWKLFGRKEGNSLVSKFADYSFNVATPQSPELMEQAASEAPRRGIAELFNKLLIDQFTPASVLVNEKGDILYTNGKTGNYLSLPDGQVSMNIHKMAREELKYAVGSCINQALAESGAGYTGKIGLKEEKQVRIVSLTSVRVEKPEMRGLIMIVFEDHGIAGKKGSVQSWLTHDRAAADDLGKELVYTKQRLNNTIEQMESSMEELKSTNEELQSTNEELQSTNEESLTTKEEMQSLNEELMTINMQYQAKAEELTRLNNDMKNLLDSTEIGTIFLDNNLDIVRYTPQVRKLFNLIPTDVGRPITHLVSNFEQPFNEDDVSSVIDDLTIKELDIRAKNGEWYRVRIMPYRTLDNFISGAVLTFTLITDFKLMQSRLRVLQDYSESLVHNSREAIAQLDSSLLMQEINPAFAKLFNVKVSQIKNQPLGKFLQQQWQTESAEQLLKKCRSSKKEQAATIKSGGSNSKIFNITVRPYTEATNSTPLIVVIINEEQETISQRTT